MIVRVRAENEKLSEVLDQLRPLGVEVTTGEETPLETALFYLARMNSKLDNLGQLRHLHKVILSIGDIKRLLEPLFQYVTDLNDERAENRRQVRRFYDMHADLTGRRPVPNKSLDFMTMDDVYQLFYKDTNI